SQWTNLYVSREHSSMEGIRRPKPLYPKNCRPRRSSAAVLVAAVLNLAMAFRAEPATMLRLVALGDSLTAGWGLPSDEAFPAVLEKVLRAQGYNVTIVNAGVSGDTASGGLARLDWTIGDGADGVILELGANDMLRGISPDVTEAAL